MHQICYLPEKFLKMKKTISLVVCFVFIASFSFSQIRKIPSAVTSAFQRQYPAAQKVEFADNLVNVQVYFVLDSTKWMAKYNSDGDWKGSEKAWSFDKLSPEVKDGFQKSKYANDWKVTETSIIYLPGGAENYRVKVEKNDVQKKYLFFDKNGRLLRDTLTI